jgi:hypothetical protein
MAETQPTAKLSCKDRNDQKWNSHRDEIHQIYVTEDKTLKETPSAIEQRHGFKARCVPPPVISCRSESLDSERKWKAKLKEWNFEKYVPADEMSFIVAKLGKRKTDEGKDTLFFRGETRITPDRIENFKKRKIVKDVVLLVADAGI